MFSEIVGCLLFAEVNTDQRGSWRPGERGDDRDGHRGGVVGRGHPGRLRGGTPADRQQAVGDAPGYYNSSHVGTGQH